VTKFRLKTKIKGSLEKCFDVARDIDLHTESMAQTAERAIAGRTSGLIGFGEEVTWEGRHFGIRQRFTSKITAFDRPVYFQDTMVRGAFSLFCHDHHFESDGSATTMVDVIEFAVPGGLLGLVVERLVLLRYLHSLIRKRNGVIKAAVEEGFKSAAI